MQRDGDDFAAQLQAKQGQVWQEKQRIFQMQRGQCGYAGVPVATAVAAAPAAGASMLSRLHRAAEDSPSRDHAAAKTMQHFWRGGYPPAGQLPPAGGYPPAGQPQGDGYPPAGQPQGGGYPPAGQPAVAPAGMLETLQQNNAPVAIAVAMPMGATGPWGITQATGHGRDEDPVDPLAVALAWCAGDVQRRL